MQSEAPTCLRCGQQLIAHRCKIQCPRCGYTEDCADAGLIDYDYIESLPRRGPQPSEDAEANGYSEEKGVYRLFSGRP